MIFYIIFQHARVEKCEKNYREPFSDSLFVGGKEGSRSTLPHSPLIVWATVSLYLFKNVCFSRVYPIVLAETCTFSCILFCV